MLAAINKQDRFTDGEYNILRIVAAYPLAVDFNSQSFQEKLPIDKHVLAQINGATLMAKLITPTRVPSTREWLTHRLREKLEERQEMRQQNKKKKPKRKCASPAGAGPSTWKKRHT